MLALSAIPACLAAFLGIFAWVVFVMIRAAYRADQHPTHDGGGDVR